MDQQHPERPPPPPPDAGWAVPDQPPPVDPPPPTWGQDAAPDWSAVAPGMPPSERPRRTGRLVALVVGSAAIIAMALGIAWVVGDSAGERGRDDVEVAGDDPDAPLTDDPGADRDRAAPGGDEGPGADPDDLPDPPEPASPEADLDPPDPASLSGVDATYAQLLVAIDASERTMIGFQDAILATLLGGSAGNPDQLLEELRTTAAASAGRLEQIRGDLEQPVDDAGAREVRDRYVEHLDTWVDYIRAIEEQPRLLDPNADTDRFTLAINVSADAFSRALQAQLPAGVDAEVARFADGILERGFRSSAESQV